MVGFFVFIITATIAFIIFMCVWKSSASKLADSLFDTVPAVAESVAPIDPDEIISIDYYIARYDGKALSIFARSGDREVFLYTLDTRIEDISSAELTQLQYGVILHGKQALAAFEEDFTS